MLRFAKNFFIWNNPRVCLVWLLYVEWRRNSIERVFFRCLVCVQWRRMESCWRKSAPLFYFINVRHFPSTGRWKRIRDKGKWACIDDGTLHCSHKFQLYPLFEACVDNGLHRLSLRSVRRQLFHQRRFIRRRLARTALPLTSDPFLSPAIVRSPSSPPLSTFE